MFFELLGPIPGELIKSTPNFKKNFIKASPENDLYIHKLCLVPRRKNTKYLFEIELTSRVRPQSFNEHHDKYHTDENYELFKELLLSIFRWKKEDRAKPSDLLNHPFMKNIERISLDIASKL
jgi:hypothetical protein